jgi:hypothetical protein
MRLRSTEIRQTLTVIPLPATTRQAPAAITSHEQAESGSAFRAAARHDER